MHSESSVKSHLKKNLALLAGALLVALLLGEVVVRIVDQLTIKSLALPFDHERHREDVWLTLHQSFNQPHRPGFEHHPVLGWTPTAGYRKNGVTINAAGIRSVTETPVQKPEGAVRIGFFGDSFAFGLDVADEEVFTALLQARWPGVEVLNFAVPGYGTDQMYLRWRELERQFDLDVAVVLLYLPDIHRDVTPFRDYQKPVFRFRDDRLTLEGVPVPSEAEVEKRLAARRPKRIFPPWYHLHLYHLVRTRMRRLLCQIGTYDYDMRVTEGILEQFQTEVEQGGGRFALVLAPRQEDAGDARGGPYGKIEKRLSRWAEEQGLPLLNLRPALAEASASGGAPLWAGHWTPKGHRMVARQIAEFLESSGLTQKEVSSSSS